MSKEKKGKFKKRKILIPILVLAVAGGGIFGVISKIRNRNTINVISVSEVQLPWVDIGENNEYYGTLKKGSVVNYKADEELEVEDILVKKGDVVSKGDVLFTYNTQSLIFNADTAENELKAIENKIKIANNELNTLKRLQPSENAPKDYEPEEQPAEETNDVPGEIPSAFEFEPEITKDSSPVSGSGSKDDPFVFLADERTVFTKDALVTLAENTGCALVYVCTPTGDVEYGRFIDGGKIDKDSVSDWVCSFGVVVDQMGGVSEQEETPFAKLVVYPNPINIFSMNAGAEMPEEPNDDGNYEMPPADQSADTAAQGTARDSSVYEISDKDNYVYTRNELNTMISNKQKEIETLGLDKKQAEINVRKAKSKLETGAETASVSGTVTFIAKDSKHLSENGYFATVTSLNGMSVSAFVGEFSRDKIAVGDSVTINDYNTGGVYTGEISYISDIPTDDNEYAQNGEASTESMYEFIVTTSEEFELGEDSGVNITVNNDEDTSDLIGLELAFAREENGRFYVLVENSDGVLEKRIVQTKGGIIWGSYIAVSDGLTLDDYRAMQYRKSCKGRIAVHMTKDSMYGILSII